MCILSVKDITSISIMLMGGGGGGGGGGESTTELNLLEMFRDSGAAGLIQRYCENVCS